MSLALIQESAKEVRRLGIAGSSLAVGDFRLKKLVAPLEQAGAKVPVFGQVAGAIRDVVEGNEAESAANLLRLSTLVNAILFTQGQTSANGDFRKLEPYPPTPATTRTTARVLKPLVEALTSTGSGRFEVVKTAWERGLFNDLRLIDPAIRALDDSYPELSDLVAEKVLPLFGPGIVPRLKQKLDPKGKKGDARRLRVMHRLDASGSLEVCRSALEEGSPEVKAAAIACLGQHEECVPLVLEQAQARNKTVRSAALEALARYDKPEVTRLFDELIKGKALDILAGPFRIMRSRHVLNSLLGEGNRVFALLLKGDQELIPRFAEILDCLEGRKEEEAEAFLLGCLSRTDPLANLKAAKNTHLAGADLLYQLAWLLHRIGSAPSLNAVLCKRDVLPPVAFGAVFRSALQAWPPNKVYDAFSPLLGSKKGPDREKAEELQQLIIAANWDDTSRFQMVPEEEAESSEEWSLKQAEWDSRWLDCAIKADRPILVCCLARPGHKAAIKYLLKLDPMKGRADAGLIVQALSHCQYARVTDHFLTLVAKKVKGVRFVSYEVEYLFHSARYLPPGDLPKLDAFAAKLDEKLVDKYLQALAPLRPTHPTA